VHHRPFFNNLKGSKVFAFTPISSINCDNIMENQHTLGIYELPVNHVFADERRSLWGYLFEKSFNESSMTV
jgi:hypothetical protein